MTVSKMNAIRIINLNYNYNGIRVDDETYHLNNESTLFSLRNGGGKSVLVQMLIAPFVHKRYRNTNRREFSSYFTTNKPTFILVEWKLDGDSGYVLTGMMVRKNQDTRDDQNENDLELFQFIHEYDIRNEYDIHNIPFIKTIDGNKKLIKFSECKKILETIKVDKDYKFSLYDMNNPTATRSYFDKLEEYQIYHKEWESIIKKINIKESGLSDLFINAKDEVGLIETWFLPAVEDKLNRGSNRIKEFQDILNSYIKQYKENKSKIDRKKVILKFREETELVLDIAENLKATTEEKSNLENKIANLIVKLRDILENLESEKNSLEEKETSLNGEIRAIEYEAISFEIYKLEDARLDLTNELSRIKDLKDDKEENKDDLIKKRSIQQCAKIDKQYREASKEVQEFENKLELAKEKEKDKRPERELLGYSLRHYYENERDAVIAKINNLQEEINKTKDNISKSEKEEESLVKTEKELVANKSEKKTQIKNYDKLEKDFNARYDENLRRNMINEYEDGSLSLRIKRLEEIKEEKSFNLIKEKKRKHDYSEKIKSTNRLIQDKNKEIATIVQKTNNQEEKLAELNKEIEVRKSIIKHIGFKKDRLFRREEILTEFQRRKDDVYKVIKSSEIMLRDFEEELEKLRSGEVLELPEDMKEALEINEVNYVYGMDWLKKNKKSQNENVKLVRNNPFIPYSLVLSANDLQKLKSQDFNSYSSFPIPIVLRENLEKEFKKEESSIYLSEKVNFYVLFNENLLDEEELIKILNEKQEEIERIKSAIVLKEEDYKQHEQNYNIIRFQNLDEKTYKKLESTLSTMKKNKTIYDNELNSLIDKENKLSKNQEELRKAIHIEEKEIERLNNKYRDMEELNKEYQKYLNRREDMIQIEDELSKLADEIASNKDKLNGFRIELSRRQESRSEYISNQKSINKELEKYLSYEEKELINKDIEDILSRYNALTKGISSELKDIEDFLSKAKRRFSEYEDDLINTSKRLEIKEEEFIDVKYDVFLYETIEKAISKIRSEIEELNDQYADTNTKIAVKDNEIDAGYKNMKESLNESETISREAIVFTDFKNRIMDKNEDLKKLKRASNYILDKLGYFTNNLSALAEFFELPIIEPIEFEYNFESMTREEIDKYRGMLLRDYRIKNNEINKRRNQLSDSLGILLRIEEFQDVFFHRPLSTLLSLLDKPSDFIEQLMITISAYEDLMAKLEVDIALVDKEKERINQILLEYISDIHKNLNKIDNNSTIKIRERPVKMLRIELSDWEAEENQYKARLETMIDELTQSGINRLENNENIEDTISPIITTKNLYNTVVGINNINIKLYKIEAERQYQISWSDVSRNSGGEGFLSAFVILSSLLSFMRRDETDIFAQSEEGKVIIMDNPFAQTSSYHLLKPLMDIANKSNTQLIAFTALGGDSIYNSFDNVYVLNPISSKLRKGVQYLKGNHAKGEEVEIIESSNVRTEEVEQLGFLF